MPIINDPIMDLPEKVKMVFGACTECYFNTPPCQNCVERAKEVALTEELPENTDPLVMYLIVRESLEMSIGKTVAQVGHAIGLLLVNYFSDKNQKYFVENDMDEWLATGYRKVTLRADDKEFEKVKNELNCFLVKDAGYTEITPGSETCVALIPMRKSLRPKLIKRLQLL